jgi:predicted transcriptional regulator
MTKKIEKAREKAEKALWELEDAILEEIACEAKKRKLDEVMFNLYGNEYRRNGKEVKVSCLDELEDYYCEHVDKGGIYRLWTKEKGWH